MSDREFTPAELERLPTPASIESPRDFDPDGLAIAIARRHGIPAALVTGPSSTPGARCPTPARARRELYGELRARGWSYPEIARFAGNRDHTTVMLAMRGKDGAT